MSKQKQVEEQVPEFLLKEYEIKNTETSNIDEIIKIKKEKESFSHECSLTPSKVKLTPENCKKLCKSVGVTYREGYEGRVIQYTFTDERVDRYGDIVRAKGVDLTNFKKNPVIMTFHNYNQFPVGNSIKTWYDNSDNTVKGMVLFVDEFVDPSGLSEIAFRMASNGVMKAASIGFRVLESRSPDESEREKLKMPRYGLIFEKSDLLELTLCPVPANVGANNTSYVQRGLFTKENINLAKEEGLEAEDLFTKMETILKEIEIRPFTNEHACRLVKPVPGAETRRKNGEREHDGKKYDVIYQKQDGKWIQQSFRYPLKNDWTEEQARSHCKSHKGILFEAAKKKNEEDSIINEEDNVGEIIQEDTVTKNNNVMSLDEDSKLIIKEMSESINTFCTSINCLKSSLESATDKIERSLEFMGSNPVNNDSGSETQELKANFDNIICSLEDWKNKLDGLV